MKQRIRDYFVKSGLPGIHPGIDAPVYFEDSCEIMKIDLVLQGFQKEIANLLESAIKLETNDTQEAASLYQKAVILSEIIDLCNYKYCRDIESDVDNIFNYHKRSPLLKK